MITRLLLLVSLLFISLSAATNIYIQKGWQLVGIPAALNDMTLFDNDNVEIVWGYDAASQQWRGYSTDDETSDKIEAAGYTLLDSLHSYQAVWVYSAASWTLELETGSAPSELNSADIVLAEGWNLVALPQTAVVSPELFGDALVWKYSDEWEVHGSAAEGLSFPDIDEIATSEGLWVKSSSDQTISMAEEASKLHTFSDEESMLEYIRDMINSNQNIYYGYMDFGVLPTNGSSDSSASSVASDMSGSEVSGSGDSSSDAQDATSTNLQEAGVDESDILKHDGTHIFYVDEQSSHIAITSFDNIVAQNFEPIETIELDTNQNVRAMYLQNDRLAIVSQTYMYYIMEGDLAASADAAIWPPQNNISTFQIDILDVSDIRHPRVYK